eukprot:2209313-Rhodomonas_salina.1
MMTRLSSYNVCCGQLSDSALAHQHHTTNIMPLVGRAQYKHCPGLSKLTTSTVQDQASSDTTS